jgi:hypothetical protein
VTADFIAVLVHLPYLLILLVFVNRYLVGAFVRISSVRRIEPAEWPSVTVTIPCFNEGATIYAFSQTEPRKSGPFGAV